MLVNGKNFSHGIFLIPGALASRFHITKYPTLKLFLNGQPAKREYRGQRSVEAFVSHAKKQLEDPTKEFSSLKDLENLDVIIRYQSRL